VTGSPPAGREGPPSVLVVCTGNICRSPAAELLLRAGLDGTGIEVSSAGVHAQVGAPVAAPMARLLRDRSVDPDGFTARQVDPAVLRRTDLVVTMTADQRSAVVSRAPAVLQRTFTLVEFADLTRLAVGRLDPGSPAERLAALVQAAPRARALRRGGRDLDDVEDPYRRPDEVFARVLGRIEAAVDELLAAIRPVAAARDGVATDGITRSVGPFG